MNRHVECNCGNNEKVVKWVKVMCCRLFGCGVNESVRGNE